MSGTTCPLCGGDMAEDMGAGDVMCDCCYLVIRYGGTYDYSLYNEAQEGEKTMTNGDKIRNMTDDDLAEFLISADATACTHCEYHYDDFGCRLDNPCVAPMAWTMLKDWLSSEAVSERSENSCSACENARN